MFHHVKELQFNARVSEPDPRFGRLLLEQFGGPNGELKAAMQYFCQAFTCRRPYPEKYDMLMDIGTEEFSHLEIVGATITMLLDGVNGELKDAEERFNWMKLMNQKSEREQIIQESMMPASAIVNNGGALSPVNSDGHPWSGTFVNSNGDLTVDLRSNIAAESRAKIVYEYLMQFTDDPLVKETLGFLMTREVAHFQMFSAALESIQPNFPPGILQGDPRYTHTYYNMSDGVSARGPWNEGQGPWPKGDRWIYVENPVMAVDQTRGLIDQPIEGTKRTPQDIEKKNHELSEKRSKEVKMAMAPSGKQMQWSEYGNGGK